MSFSQSLMLMMIAANLLAMFAFMCEKLDIAKWLFYVSYVMTIVVIQILIGTLNF